MLHRMRRHATFANVIALTALFVALGGGAYAAKKLNGKTIKNASIPAKKLKPNVLKNLDKCPTEAPDKVAGICYSGEKPTTNWDAAMKACAALNLRLPSPGEGLLIAIKTASSGQIWTDDVAELNPGNQRVSVRGVPPDIFAPNVAGPLPYRCILNATN